MIDRPCNSTQVWLTPKPHQELKFINWFSSRIFKYALRSDLSGFQEVSGIDWTVIFLCEKKIFSSTYFFADVAVPSLPSKSSDHCHLLFSSVSLKVRLTYWFCAIVYRFLGDILPKYLALVASLLLEARILHLS